MNPRILAITGMHRSGTSLVAEYLQACGLFIGDRLRDGGELECGSRAGHHEDLAFMSFGDRALQAAGVGPFPADGCALPICGDRIDRERAEALFSERTQHRQWGWKDPRTCLMLDFWHQQHTDLSYLFMIRDPVEAVSSLVRRNRDRHIVDQPVLGLKTWLIYNGEILRFYRSHAPNCFVLEFDSLTNPDDDVIGRVAETFDFNLARRPIGEVMEERFIGRGIAPAVETARARHRDLFVEATNLYRRLLTCAEESRLRKGNRPAGTERQPWSDPWVRWREAQR